MRTSVITHPLSGEHELFPSEWMHLFPKLLHTFQEGSVKHIFENFFCVTYHLLYFFSNGDVVEGHYAV